MNSTPTSALAVRIRPFRGEDAAALHAAACESTEPLRAAMTWFHSEYSLQDAASFVVRSPRDWYKGARYEFAIVDGADDSFLGSVGLSQIDRRHKLANVGFWVRRSRMGQGIATVAGRQLADFGFNELGLERLEFLVARSNLASQRVVTKLGARLEGTLRKRLVLSGEAEDAILYSLIKNDLEPAPAVLAATDEPQPCANGSDRVFSKRISVQSNVD